MLSHGEILTWLREEDPARLEELYARADRVRREKVGEAVHLRGLVEISNYCARECGYCGIRLDNRAIDRYRMSEEEILACAHLAVEYGYGTVVMQAGEDAGITRSFMEGVVRRIKTETPLAVTLSLGERSEEELRAWRAAGADRFLLRFETSDEALFQKIHPVPEGGAPNRIALLPLIKALGYQTGSGVMVGIPGQTYETLARDVQLFGVLELDMIGVGPYIPHPATPLAARHAELAAPAGEQVPSSEEMAFKVVALARLMRPEAHIPATTALATINPAEGRVLGLRRGANVVMPNLTPLRYRERYEIYPNKASSRETADVTAEKLRTQLEAIGRPPGTGPGGAGDATS